MHSEVKWGLLVCVSKNNAHDLAARVLLLLLLLLLPLLPAAPLVVLL
jgi:hypothetical protein